MSSTDFEEGMALGKSIGWQEGFDAGTRWTPTQWNETRPGNPYLPRGCECEWDAIPPNIACPIHREPS